MDRRIRAAAAAPRVFPTAGIIMPMTTFLLVEDEIDLADPIARDYLLETVWIGKYETGDRSVDNAVLRLRKKLGRLGGKYRDCVGCGI
ncbi:MAG: winged helix-turn-helix domain-containing protein [Anaerolineales bacterium]|nr:winged helix-turn-helix domain-containing protein [Anaerolineales bacterium]